MLLPVWSATPWTTCCPPDASQLLWAFAFESPQVLSQSVPLWLSQHPWSLVIACCFEMPRHSWLSSAIHSAVAIHLPKTLDKILMQHLRHMHTCVVCVHACLWSGPCRHMVTMNQAKIVHTWWMRAYLAESVFHWPWWLTQPVMHLHLGFMFFVVGLFLCSTRYPWTCTVRLKASCVTCVKPKCCHCLAVAGCICIELSSVWVRQSKLVFNLTKCWYIFRTFHQVPDSMN